MWHDNETREDLLGFQVHGDLTRKVITNKKMLPVSVGLFGDWGSGKTSVMKMLQYDLDPDNWPTDTVEHEQYKKVACLYFNGWMFEGYDDAKSAILSAILTSLGEHKRFGAVAKDKVVTLLKSVNWTRAIRLGMQHVAAPALAAYVSGGATVVPSLINAFTNIVPTNSDDSIQNNENNSDSESEVNWESLIRNSPDKDGPLDLRSFRKDFSKLLEECKIDSLVIIVDDLDRCSPERIIDNLEAIKLFLSVEHTAFVIGADKRIVEHAIRLRYQQQDTSENNEVIKDYLEKLIQVPYNLPRLSPAETETYMNLLFCQKYLSSDNLIKCLDSYKRHLCENRYAIFGYGAIEMSLEEERMTDELFCALRLCSQIAPLLTEGLKGNPRQIKRFLNALTLRLDLADVAGILEHVDKNILVKLMVLEYVSEPHFVQLYNWQASQDGQPEQLKKLEEILDTNLTEDLLSPEIEKIDKNWSSTNLIKWLRMAPKLSSTDLRDYFWLSRDRLNSSLSEVAMVSPIIRKAMEELISGTKFGLNSGKELVKKFNPNEREIILGLLKSHTERHLDENNGFNAIRTLIEEDIPGAPMVLVDIFTNCPLDDIPPAVGMDIATFLRQKPQYQEIFAPVVEKLMTSKTKVGKSYKQGIETKR